MHPIPFLEAVGPILFGGVGNYKTSVTVVLGSGKGTLLG